MEFKVLCHSSIRFILDDKIIYFDPFNIKEKTYDADIIFITHNHYDHYSKEDIDKLATKDTKIVMPYGTNPYNYGNIMFVKPDENYIIDDLKFSTVKAYNKDKKYHKESDGFVGYILEIENKKYFIMGDQDENPDNLKIKADYIFIPIGGTYTFDFIEAALYINKVKPFACVLTHYTFSPIKEKCIDEFMKYVNKEIKVYY